MVFKKIFGVILILIGIPLTFIYMLWPLSGNHGATWLEFLPILAATSSLIVIGIFLVRK